MSPAPQEIALWTSLCLDGSAAREFKQFKVNNELLDGEIAYFKNAYKKFREPLLDHADDDQMKVFLAGATEPSAAEIRTVVAGESVRSSDTLATVLAKVDKPESGIKRVFFVITAPAAGAPRVVPHYQSHSPVVPAPAPAAACVCSVQLRHAAWFCGAWRSLPRAPPVSLVLAASYGALVPACVMG